MKSYLSIFVISFILISSNTSYAQFEDFVPQNLINAPGVFNFNTANSITGNQTRIEIDSDGMKCTVKEGLWVDDILDQEHSRVLEGRYDL